MDAAALRALRRFCMDCQGNHPPAVAECRDAACALHPFRQCTVTPLADEARPLRGIRRHCLACAGSRDEVRRCDARETCPLWSFRFGVTPATFKRVALRRKRAKETLRLPGL